MPFPLGDAWVCRLGVCMIDDDAVRTACRAEETPVRRETTTKMLRAIRNLKREDIAVSYSDILR
ncbi:hypothetical protein GALMADRAFT_1165525 [Galerina marginata CBS 339.88]|uniref:Uncharacterized protein n=1 Tax=Galerina marginata (strain CBS 339.88) TaxID=685588 RepID=A0A067T9F9_GALM3|nr:hypothetical protein GALMADRAFT_1165525 [Galerina marginata CBS 339.88]